MELNCQNTIATNLTEFGNFTEKCVQTTIDDVIREIRPSLMTTDLPVSLIYIIIMGTGLLLGSVGNILILCSTCNNCVSRVGKEFIINLAVADFCVAGIADPMCILGVVKGESFFDDKIELCHIIASFCLTACFCAFMSLLMLSLNRYIFLCHNEWYDRIYRKPVIIMMCIGCWLLAVIFEFPNFIGWGGHYFDRKNHQCIWDRTASRSYTLFVALGLILGPLFAVGVMHFLIFRYILHTKQNLYAFKNPDQSRKDLVWKETINNCRTIFFIFVIFIVCWTPYATVLVLDENNNLSMEIHLFVTLLAHYHSSANCVLYFACNRKYRKFVLRTFGLSACYRFVQESKSKSTSTFDSIQKTVNETDQKIYSIEKKLTVFET